jgi:multidrug efflux system outer membrane protein
LTNAAAPVAEDIEWNAFFIDARLKQIISLALTNNRDLRVAALNVESARAQYKIQRSALLPTVNAEAGFARSRTPATLTGTGSAVTSSDYTVKGAVASYELDLFGRVRSLKAKALETFLAKEENRKSVQISLIAEIADQYLAEREMDEQLALSRQTLSLVQSNYDLIEASFKLGNTAEPDLRSAEIQVQSARASVASYQRQLAQARNALVLLLGASLPDNLPPAPALDAETILASLSPGLPSDTLQRRPDILEAEHSLKAANANIGAARAAFFPKILLTGSAGTASADLSGLFEPGSAAWSFSPQITIPIFDMGNTKASFDVAKISKHIEIAQYEKAIQTAFREVADALAARSAWDDQLDANRRLVKAQQQRFDSASARYREGIDSYLAVLTAQQDLFSSQQTLILTRYSQLVNRIELYRALGGGWSQSQNIQTVQNTAMR